MCNRCLSVNRRQDPTRTTALRRRLEAEVNRRWRHLRGEVRDYLNRAEWPMDADALQRFFVWLDGRIADDLLDGASVEDLQETEVPPAWVRDRVDESYEKGAEHATSQVSAAGVALGVTAAAILARRSGQSRRSNQFRQIADDLASQISDTRRAMRRQITESAEARAPRSEAVAAASDRMRRVGQNRMRMLARTEIVKGHHKATMTVYEYAEVEDVGVLAEIQTAGDDRVCVECEALEMRGAIPLAEAENLIPVHPGCRCALVVITVRHRDEREVA